MRYLLETDQETAGARVRTVAVKVTRIYLRDRWRFSPRRLGDRVDRIALHRPIFLLETQGSGATLIGRTLRRSPAVVTVSGGCDHWTGTDEIGVVRNRMVRLPPSLWGSSHRSDIADGTFGTEHSSVFACDELLPFYRASAEQARPGDATRLQRLLREHIAVLAPESTRARFLDKTQTYAVKMPLLAALLEEARPMFVLVVRNPYGTCTWALRCKPPSFSHTVPYEQRLRLIAEHWANAHRIALEDARLLDDVAVVRFEDFLTDPQAVVYALCEFTQLDYHPTMVPGPGQALPWATLPNDRKWYPLYPDDRLEQTTPPERDIVEANCHALATRFGYQRDGHTPMTDPIEIIGRAPVKPPLTTEGPDGDT